jgi:hypothetical protein
MVSPYRHTVPDKKLSACWTVNRHLHARAEYAVGIRPPAGNPERVCLASRSSFEPNSLETTATEVG